MEITREIKTSLTAWGADPSTDSATKKQIAAALLTLYAVNPVDLLPATPEMLNGICRNIGTGRADILHRRCFNAVRRFAFENKLTLDGLALSGGGIRSAAICLGVLQALARRGLLSKFQYVSAVSGGGYIASWLSAWAYRDDGGIQGVEQILGQRVAPSGGHGIRGNDPRRDGEEAEPVRWLRRHVLYLSPRLGVLDSDTWGLAVGYIRNLLLHLLVVAPLLGALLGLPMITLLLLNEHEKLAQIISRVDAEQSWLPLALLILCAFLCRIGSLFALAKKRPIPSSSLSQAIKLLIFTGAAVLLTCAIALLRPNGFAMGTPRFHLLPNSIEHFVFSAFGRSWLGYCVLPSIPITIILRNIIGPASFDALDERIETEGLLARTRESLSRVVAMAREPLKSILSILVGGFITGLLCFWLSALESPLLQTADLSRWVIALGPLAWILVFGAGETIASAAYSKTYDDSHRASWAKTGGEGVRAGTAWACLSLMSLWANDFFSFAIFDELGFRVSFAAFLVIALLFYTFKQFRRELSFVLFSVVALMLLTAITHAAIFSEQIGTTQTLIRGTVLILMAIASSVFLSWIVSINRYSLHSLYRDALARTFLGASRPSPRSRNRVPPMGCDPAEERQFQSRTATGSANIDSDDSPLLKWMLPNRRLTNQPTHRCPLLILNACLNAIANREQSGSLSREHSFTFSSLHVGSATTGYSDTKDYFVWTREKGITLAAAMAISGAAVSPRTGDSHWSLSSFLLTVANARLGAWIGHPGSGGERKVDAPRFPFWNFLLEFTGRNTDEDRWLHLSDGGHFDNLGVYELVRRGSPRIIAIDASCDPESSFDDLAKALRRCETELGVSFQSIEDFRVGRTSPDGGVYAGAFLVHYIHRPQPGLLLYIKPGFDQSDAKFPLETLHYGRRSSEFPHEATVHQFFTAAQFEAYRELGEHIIERIDPKATARTLPLFVSYGIAHACGEVMLTPDELANRDPENADS